MLAYVYGCDCLTNVGVVLQYSLTLSECFDRDFVTDGDVVSSCRLNRSVLIHDPTLEYVTGFHALDNNNTNRVSLIVDNKMDHAEPSSTEMTWGRLSWRGIAAGILCGGSLLALSGVQAAEPISALPPAPSLDTRKVALGEALFKDRRLSKDNSLACVSCHDIDAGGADGLALPVGVGGARGKVNAPTVFNSSLNFRQFWDGRAATLEEQAAGPVHNPVEMASNWGEVIAKLRQDKALSTKFQQVYGTSINAQGIQDAIATFERTLVTPNSRFDRYLNGDTVAMNAEELQGYELFKRHGCSSCHQGVNIGGNMYQVFGVMGDYFSKRGNPTEADLGRYNVTRKESDRHVFKVPSLRNVAVTAPYFHDGSAKTLEQAVEVMFIYQLGRPVEPRERELIVKFLHSLTGEYRGKTLVARGGMVNRIGQEDKK